METQKDRPKHKHDYLVIQYKWQDTWIDCTDCIYFGKISAITKLIMLRAEQSGITYRLIRRTEEEIA